MIHSYENRPTDGPETVSPELEKLIVINNIGYRELISAMINESQRTGVVQVFM